MSGPWVSLIIAGSQTVEPRSEDINVHVRDWVISMVGEPAKDPPERFISEVIVGEGYATDDAGDAWASIHRIHVHREPITKEDFARHGSYWAPKMRNRRAADRATHAIIFWDGESANSCDLAARMLARKKHVIVIPMRATRKKSGRPGNSSRPRGQKSNPETTPDRRRPD